MHIAVNGTRLWFDVDGQVLVPDGAGMHERPTVILVHGGPASYDHSYFKPGFARLALHAQVVYLDLRDHGRSAHHDPAAWSFEGCADDLRAFCDALGVVRPIVFGHSMGGIIAMLYGARHPGHAGALILQSTMARFDLGRLVAGFRTMAGDEVAGFARRDYSGNGVTEEEWAKVFAAFGPEVPNPEQLARRIRNDALGLWGLELLRQLNVTDQLASITCPALVCVGDRDPVTPPSAAQEIIDSLPPKRAHLQVIAGAGHFPWLDSPERFWPLIIRFLTADHVLPV